MANPFFTDPDNSDATIDTAQQVIRDLDTQSSHVTKALALPGSHSEHNKQALTIIETTKQDVRNVIAPAPNVAPQAPKNTTPVSDANTTITSHGPAI